MNSILTELSEDGKTLDLSGTKVTDLTPLAGLAKLEALDLRGTKVTDLTPLAGLTNLIMLDLRGTKVIDLTPIAGLQVRGLLIIG